MSETNPWRYFRCVEDNYIRRVRYSEGCVFGPDGIIEIRVAHLNGYAQSSLFREITEAEAVTILGCCPWETQSPATSVQPAPTPTSGRPVWEMVIEDMHARNRFGAEKHGTTLQVDNGRDKLVDAYQEELDKCVYMRAWIEQRNAAVALLRESKQFCGTKTSEMIDQAIAMLMGGGK